MRGIILDTNFLMIPFVLNVDIFSQIKQVCDFPYGLYVVDKTVLELKKIVDSKQKGKDKKAANIALSLIERYDIKVIETDHGYVDDLLVELAENEGYFVATQDAELKKRLKVKNLPVIFLRQKKYIVVEK